MGMYDKCGSMGDARQVLGNMREANRWSWNSIIGGYRRHGESKEALALFRQMRRRGVSADEFILATILPACAQMECLEEGMEIHQSIIKGGFLADVVVVNALIDMYEKCGSMNKARYLFDKMRNSNVVSWTAIITGYARNDAVDEALLLFAEMPQRNVVSWAAIITGCTQNELVEKALAIFKEMQLVGVKPSSEIFTSVFQACAKERDLKHGEEVHQRMVESGVFLDAVLMTALIDMYAKCGRIHKARQMFDKMARRDSVSWNAMIAGYAQNGNLDEALKLFKEMPRQNVVSWTALIAGYAQNGFIEKALEVFREMQLARVQPNSATFASILPACAKLGALQQGMEMHQQIVESRFSSEIVVANALIDMYAKCGSIQMARKLFDKMRNTNFITWTAIISGYAMHGYSKDALKLFDLMKHSGTNPDHVSFVWVLYACSHGGLVEQGCEYFNSMSHFDCILPRIDHYICMVDLLGRAGYIEESLNFIIKMPIIPDVVVWVSLLGSCRSHKNIKIGELAATPLLELDPKCVACYVLLSNIYAQVGRWDDVHKLRNLMKDRKIQKIPGCSWIEVHKMVHVFCVGDRSHSQTPEIYS
ncbi:pentatricopeptide repeat-containing protein At2g13600 [Cryptomeria japonica]|uniref:pentatricopeptide repeat-containing protein At2g13600 n=1 Tax=Cryptomeria japonica TaxID=3369 RepID=UPI0027DA8A69|nr:pentatricopeptide repeat-containing protein At2g13600 [Cryptomeria japonica]